MKNVLLIVALVTLLSPNLKLVGQVTFILESIPEYTPPEDDLYIAGGFNGWNPGDVNSQLTKNDEDLWETSLDGFPDGTTIYFKFTRGDWGTVEKGPNGEEINDRSFTFGNGDTVRVTIHNWADFGGGGNSTAAENVFVMDEDFYMPQLGRTRRIWLYLPPGYEASDAYYPVLYMHDGQNLFDEITAFAGEWEVDETLNKLAQQGYQVPIVVGIDNGGVYRIDELTPWYNVEYDAGGQGDEYIDFIVEDLKPYIDENYRTLSDSDNTGLMGSSLGGLISWYGALKYPEVFSKSGIFSPAYWINSDSIWNFLDEATYTGNSRFYQNIGENEGATNIHFMNRMEDSLRQIGFEEVISKVIENGAHNEQTWRDDFATAYLWLFAPFANSIAENSTFQLLDIYPNPVKTDIFIQQLEIKPEDSIRIFNSNGILIKEISGQTVAQINVEYLKDGTYILIVITMDAVYVTKFVKL